MSELTPREEHESLRREGALALAIELHPRASTEEVIEVARKFAAFIVGNPSAEVVKLVGGKK